MNSRMSACVSSGSVVGIYARVRVWIYDIPVNRWAGGFSNGYRADSVRAWSGPRYVLGPRDFEETEMDIAS